jgi:hypothetical protein
MIRQRGVAHIVMHMESRTMKTDKQKDNELLWSFLDLLQMQTVPVGDEPYLIVADDIKPRLFDIYGELSDIEVVDKIIELMQGQTLFVKANKGPEIGYVVEEVEIANRSDLEELLLKDIKPLGQLVW